MVVFLMLKNMYFLSSLVIFMMTTNLISLQMLLILKKSNL